MDKSPSKEEIAGSNPVSGSKPLQLQLSTDTLGRIHYKYNTFGGAMSKYMKLNVPSASCRLTGVGIEDLLGDIAVLPSCRVWTKYFTGNITVLPGWGQTLPKESYRLAVLTGNWYRRYHDTRPE